MKNKDVIQLFVDGNSKDAKTKNVFIDGDTLYSYGYHFPLCIKLLDGWVVNNSKYSQTTSKHQSYLRQSLNRTGLPIIEMSNTDIRTFLSKHPQPVKFTDIVAEKI